MELGSILSPLFGEPSTWGERLSLGPVFAVPLYRFPITPSVMECTKATLLPKGVLAVSLPQPEQC